MDEITDWQEVPSPPQAQAAPPQDPGDWKDTYVNPSVAGFAHPERIKNGGHAIDENTGEEIPLAMSGITPATAMNKSPPSAMDRVKLSLGNFQGNLRYLQQKYESVQMIPDKEGKPTTDLAVLDKGTWYRVDPINSKMKYNPDDPTDDPWAKTKEYMIDVAEFAPSMVIGGIVGAALEAPVVAAGGAATVATGGAAAPAAAAGIAATAAAAGSITHSITTSLGRLVGTYEATPQEQIWDNAFESLLSAGGAKIAAGVKPKAGWVAERLPKIAKAFEDSVQQLPYGKPVLEGTKTTLGAINKTGNFLVSAPKAVFRATMSTMSVGMDHFDRMVAKPNGVATWMKQAGAAAAGRPSAQQGRAYQTFITNRQLEDVHKMAETVVNTLPSKLYSATQNELLAKVPANFSAHTDDVIRDVYTDAINRGFGKVVVGDSSLTGKEAVEFLNKKGFAQLAAAGKARFEVLSRPELKTATNLGDEAAYISNNETVHKAISGFYDEFHDYLGKPGLKGPEAAREIIKLKKTLGQTAYELGQREDLKAFGNTVSILNNARHQLTTSVHNKFEEASPELGAKFLEMNDTFNAIRTATGPLQKAYENYRDSNNLAAYGEILGTYINPTSGKTVGIKQAAMQENLDSGLDFLQNLAKEKGLKNEAKLLSGIKDDIMVKETAKVFNPIKPGELKASDQEKNSLMAGLYAAQTGNISLLNTALTLKFLRGPYAARAGVAVSRATWATKEFVTKTPGKILDNPQALQALSTSAASAASAYTQTSNSLNQMIDATKQFKSGP